MTADPAPLPERIVVHPPVIDSRRADRLRDRLGGDVFAAWGSDGAAFLDAVFAASPYLGRLACQRPDILTRLAAEPPEAICKEAEAAARAAGRLESEDAVSDALREAKQAVHLAAALADLSGVWSVAELTGAVTRLADTACQGAFEAAARLHGFPEPGEAAYGPVPGVFVLALGKHGAGTLNYSSDIDLVAAWEPDRAAAPEGKEKRRAFAKLIQTTARLLSDVTARGYVFRVDLRLRPDPGSTPIAVNADMARHYFEAVGQNWERAAYAKARVVAGDITAGEAFLDDLSPFIWRRTLDFAAVEDIHALAAQIQSVGRRAEIRAAGHDVKLGRGGIREIEFYAQVLQLVFGGRKPDLRVRDTVGGLQALASHDLVAPEDAEGLIEDYRFLRAIEHRIQMREDEQSQTLPGDDHARAAIAALAGYAELSAFDAEVEAVLRRVHGRFSAQFPETESLATSAGSLVLTGVEPTPDTLATLRRHGFSEPEAVWSKLSGWAAGRARAARTERARRLFSRLAPRLVEAIGATGDADAALRRFSVFFENLPSGVQVLSLLANYPELADELIAILGLAPRLAETLAHRPGLLDVMLEPSFATPLREDAPGARAARFEAIAAAPFEDALNAARIAAREEKLRIGAQLLLGRTSAEEAGAAYADLADAALHAMARAAEAEVARRHGPPPGRWAVLALGKFGGREMSSESDLDLMLVYEAAQERSDGAKPLSAQDWFARFAQRLVAALSAPTQEGELFPVDMALRPSGRQGPIAVSLARFGVYYAEEAWTWELMALTRGRVAAASDGFASAVEDALDTAVAAAAPADTIRADAADMRARLERDKPARSNWDLKLKPGGVIDIEFIAQTGQLLEGARMHPATAPALRDLAGVGRVSDADAQALADAVRDYAALIALIRLAHGSDFDAHAASAPFMERLCAAVGAHDPAALEARLSDHACTVRALFERYVAPVAARGDG